jgi:putative peptidoglycan lipid II flippase
MKRLSSVARAAGAVALATGLSRLLGLAREMTLSHRFPAAETDAFIAAFRVPDLLRNLLAEGALAAAFIPVFAALLARRGEEAAFRLASSILNTLMLAGGALALLVIVFARGYATLLAPGFSSEAIALTAWLGQLMSPFLLTVGLSATLIGMAQVRGRFFVPALAPALFNVGVLIGGWGIAPWLESRGIPGVTGMALGALLGGVLQLLLQVPGARSAGYRHSWSLGWDDADTRRVLGRLLPAALGVGALYLHLLVDTHLASRFGTGAVSYLFYAIRIWMLPIGLFAVAIGTVNLAGTAVDAARGDMEALRGTLAASLRMTLLFALPAALGLMVLARPIVRVVYEHGLFEAADTLPTSIVLLVYGLGLPGYALVKVLVPTFYALEDAWTPARIALACVVLKIVFSLGAVSTGHFFALPLVTALAVLVQALWAWFLLRGRAGSLEGLHVGRAFVMALVSCALVALIAPSLLSAFELLLPGEGWGRSACRLLAAILSGVIPCGVVVLLSGLPEARWLRSKLPGRGGNA